MYGFFFAGIINFQYAFENVLSRGKRFHPVFHAMNIIDPVATLEEPLLIMC